MAQRLTTLFVVDPLDELKAYKDTSVAMMRELARRGIAVFACTPAQLALRDSKVLAQASELELPASDESWYVERGATTAPLTQFDAVLMRKDPPFDVEFLNATLLLSRAAAQGARVFNDPQSLRDHNEKLAVAEFPQYTVPTLVTRDLNLLRQFHAEMGDVVVKPLDGMGGRGVFHLRRDDPNLNAILEIVSEYGNRSLMAQRFIPEITAGDKRVLLIAGKPVPFSLARVPKPGESRGNLAAEKNARMINLVKKLIQKLPYPLFLRIFYVWFFIRKALRAEYVRCKVGLPLLSLVDLRKYKRSDVLFILGTGPSINQISAQRWQAISRHDTLGLNFWLYHPFVPTFYVVESSPYGGPRDTVTRRIKEAANRRAIDYDDTIKIITDLYQSGRQWAFDVDPAFRLVHLESRHDRGRPRQGLAGAGRHECMRAQGAGAQSPDRHLSGRHPPAARRRAAIQVRHRSSLRGDERPVPAGGAQFRPVLAAPHLHALSRHAGGGISRSVAAGIIAR